MAETTSDPDVPDLIGPLNELMMDTQLFMYSCPHGVQLGHAFLGQEIIVSAGTVRSLLRMDLSHMVEGCRPETERDDLTRRHSHPTIMTMDDASPTYTNRRRPSP